jgi:hypothetical protein
MTNKGYVPKVLETQKGEFYYAATCPATGNILFIAPDPSGGRNPVSRGWHVIPCHHCQGTHQFADRQVFSLIATGEE